MTLKEFNTLPGEEQTKQLLSCCGCVKWQKEMRDKIPFVSTDVLVSAAGTTWYDVCNEADWQEAFSHHPKIGETMDGRGKFALTEHFASKEQEAITEAPSDILSELAVKNREYEARFGFIFIVCATGRTANQMLALLKSRIMNGLTEELHIAMGEQYKITLLRLQKLIDEAEWKLSQSQLTTHVLDTSIGQPGRDIVIRVKEFRNEIWRTFAQGITDADGRLNDLLPPARRLLPGNYKMGFDTAAYFSSQKIMGFYPEVEIQFSIKDEKHYHVPLLVNPFGYSTYRGS